MKRMMTVLNRLLLVAVMLPGTALVQSLYGQVIGGFVRNCNGVPVEGVQVQLFSSTLLTPLAATSNSFGLYFFDVSTMLIPANIRVIADESVVVGGIPDLADGLQLLNCLYQGGAPLNDCQLTAADMNGDRSVNIADAFLWWYYTWGGGPAPVSDMQIFDESIVAPQYPASLSRNAFGISAYVGANILDLDFTAVLVRDVNLDDLPKSIARQPEVKLDISVSSIDPQTGNVTYSAQLNGDILNSAYFSGISADLQFDASPWDLVSAKWNDQLYGKEFITNAARVVVDGRKVLHLAGFTVYPKHAVKAEGELLTFTIRISNSAPHSFKMFNTGAFYAEDAGKGRFKFNEAMVAGGGGSRHTDTAEEITGGIANAAAEITMQNSPNPFNPSTQIRYQLPEAASVRLEVYNSLGQKIRTLVNSQKQSAGSHSIEWNGRNNNGLNAPSGVYFSRLEISGSAGVQVKTQKMMLMK